MSQESKLSTVFKMIFGGKAHTSPQKKLIENEFLTAGLSLSSNTIFAQDIPLQNPNSTRWSIDSEGIVERVRLEIFPIQGTESTLGTHAFEIRLPSDYENHSNNPKKGSFPFTNGQVLEETIGLVQIISKGHYKEYLYDLYDENELLISPTDERDWIVYTNGGIIYQDIPPSNTSRNPKYLDCWIYIGDTVKKKIDVYKGAFSDYSTLKTKHPTAEKGDYAILDSTKSVWIWNTSVNNWIDTNANTSIVDGNMTDNVIELENGQSWDGGEKVTISRSEQITSTNTDPMIIDVNDDNTSVNLLSVDGSQLTRQKLGASKVLEISNVDGDAVTHDSFGSFFNDTDSEDYNANRLGADGNAEFNICENLYWDEADGKLKGSFLRLKFSGHYLTSIQPLKESITDNPFTVPVKPITIFSTEECP